MTIFARFSSEKPRLFLLFRFLYSDNWAHPRGRWWHNPSGVCTDTLPGAGPAVIPTLYALVSFYVSPDKMPIFTRDVPIKHHFTETCRLTTFLFEKFPCLFVPLDIIFCSARWLTATRGQFPVLFTLGALVRRHESFANVPVQTRQPGEKPDAPFSKGLVSADFVHLGLCSTINEVLIVMQCTETAQSIPHPACGK